MKLLHPLITGEGPRTGSVEVAAGTGMWNRTAGSGYGGGADSANIHADSKLEPGIITSEIWSKINLLFLSRGLLPDPSFQSLSSACCLPLSDGRDRDHEADSEGTSPHHGWPQELSPNGYQTRCVPHNHPSPSRPHYAARELLHNYVHWNLSDQTTP